MKSFRFILAASLAACAAAPQRHEGAAARGQGNTSAIQMTKKPLDYPRTRREDIAETLHGTLVRDPYRWLEDGSSREVTEWSDAQDRFAHQVLSALPQRPRFVEHLRNLMYAGEVRAPTKRGNSYFYWKRDASEEKLLFIARDGLRGTERIVLDSNALGSNGSTVSIVGAWVSPSGRYIAYKLSENNADAAILKIRDLNIGKDLPEEIPGVRHNDVGWLPRDAGFFYRASPAIPTLSGAQKIIEAQVKYHELGTPISKDLVIRDRAGDVNLDENPIVSSDGRWLCIAADHGFTRTDVFFRDLRQSKTKSWKTLAEGRDAVYTVSVYKDRFYLRTNDGAPRYQVFAVDPEHPERRNWKVVVAERPDATLTDVQVVGGRLVLQWLKDAVSQLEVADLQGRSILQVPFGKLGTLDKAVGGVDDREAFVRFSSFTVAPTIFRIDVTTGEKDVFAEVPSAPDAAEYVTEQTYFASKDGTRIPMFIVRGKTARPDAQRPTLLYGYGGFEMSLVPTYRPALLAWLREGGIYAAPNLRGGGEFGADWHRAGMLEKKQNVFDDYIAAAEHLVQQRWTKPQFIAAKGQSNGGLLVAAAIAQRPDLFRVALPRVPITDMVRYTTTAAGKTWIPEYGSPEIPSQFTTLLGYSPYHHIEKGRAYPSVLLLTSDSDDRLDPMHGRKFVAALQSASSGGPVLLSVQRNAGHRGADAVKSWVTDEADSYAFAFAEMGLP